MVWLVVMTQINFTRDRAIILIAIHSISTVSANGSDLA